MTGGTFRAVKALVGRMQLPATMAALVLGLSGAALAQEASVYKWVDSDGVPHYSDQPPAGVTAEETIIRYRKTDTGMLTAKAAKEKTALDEAGQVREGQTAEDQAAADEERKKNLSEREAGCEQARQRVAKYEQARRIFRPGPNGERVYLSDEELDAERANARRAVGDWCGE